MLYPWPGKQPALLGVDITPHAVRLIQLGKRQRRRTLYYCVECCASQSIVTSSVTPGETTALATSRALQQALQKAGTRTRRAAIAVPSTAVMSKTVSLPSELSDLDMESQVWLEAEQLIPVPLAELMIDFVVLGPSATALHQVDVLIVAARRKAVEQRLALLQAAELDCRIVDLVPDVMQRAYRAFLYPMDDPEACYALLILEQHSFYLAVFVGDTMVDHQIHNTGVNQWELLHTINHVLSACMQTYGTLTQLWLAGPCDENQAQHITNQTGIPCLLYTSPSPRDKRQSRMPSSA